jgi:hypothetical protein
VTLVQEEDNTMAMGLWASEEWVKLSSALGVGFRGKKGKDQGRFYQTFSKSNLIQNSPQSL